MRAGAWPPLILAAAVFVLLVACGSGGSGSSAEGADGTGASSDTSAASDGQADELRDCLAAQGVEVPEGFAPGEGGAGGGGAPPSVPAGADPTVMQEAFAACQSELGATGAGQGFDAYASCLADNGVARPSEPATEDGRSPSLDQEDPTVAAAAQTCAPLRSGPPGTPGGSSSTTTAP